MAPIITPGSGFHASYTQMTGRHAHDDDDEAGGHDHPAPPHAHPHVHAADGTVVPEVTASGDDGGA